VLTNVGDLEDVSPVAYRPPTSCTDWRLDKTITVINGNLRHQHHWRHFPHYYHIVIIIVIVIVITRPVMSELPRLWLSGCSDLERSPMSLTHLLDQLSAAVPACQKWISSCMTHTCVRKYIGKSKHATERITSPAAIQVAITSFTPHRRHETQTAAVDDPVAWRVCKSLCLSVTHLRSAKAASRIDGRRLRGGQETLY